MAGYSISDGTQFEGSPFPKSNTRVIHACSLVVLTPCLRRPPYSRSVRPQRCPATPPSDAKRLWARPRPPPSRRTHHQGEDSKASRPQRTLNRSLGTHPSPPPAPTRHTVGPTSDNHPTPQPAGHSARRPREPSGSATWAPRRDRGGQTPTRRLQRTTQLPFMNRASNDFPYTGLPGPPSLTFCSVFVFVRVFVCMSVCIFARCRMYA